LKDVNVEQSAHFGLSKASNCHQVGQKNRSVASTLMNNESSRSHSIFTVTVEILEKGWARKWETETLPPFPVLDTMPVLVP